MTLRNKFSTGDELELLTNSGGPLRFTVGELRDAEDTGIETARRAMMEVHMKLPCRAARLSLLRKARET